MSLEDVIDKQAELIEAQRRAISEAHFLICWTYQNWTENHPPMVDGVAQWRVWHLEPSARDHMNSGEQSLYDALMALKRLDGKN